MHHSTDDTALSQTAPVTLADIAKATGFSPMTVSNALRGKPKVSEKNRARIKQVAAEMGYQVNAAASMLRNNRSGIIQVVVDDFEVPFHARIAKYLTQAASGYGYQLVVRQSSSLEREEVRALRSSPGLLYDGIILDAPNITEDQVIGHVQGKPALVIGDCASFTRVNSMDTACVQGMTMAVEHLWRQGCRTFRVLGAAHPSMRPLRHGSGNGFGPRRMAAIDQTLRRHGIEIAPSQCVDCERTMAGGRDAARRMLDNPIWMDDLHSNTIGVLCLSDTIALGALRELADRRIPVPHDVKVMGFDGIPMGAYANPSLSTVEMDVPAMAQTVLLRMLGMIEAREQHEPMPSIAHDNIPFRLIPRDSTAIM